MPSGPMDGRVAVVGMGSWGRNLVRNFHQIGALAAVCDSSDAAEALCATQYPSVPFVRDYRVLLANPEITAVAVATPAVTHFDVAKAALESSVRYLASDLGPRNIRVNAVSAGPIKTLAAMGISGFSSILQVYRERSPLKRNVDLGEVADATAFLLSPASRAITGEVLMVDAGYHVLGM